MPEFTPRAGALVYKIEDGIIFYLLVLLRENSSRFIIPQGHVEEGETAAQAAQRETCEEAGAEIQIEKWLGELELPNGILQIFLARYIAKAEPLDSRVAKWMTMAQLEPALAFADTLPLIRRTHEELYENHRRT